MKESILLCLSLVGVVIAVVSGCGKKEESRKVFDLSSVIGFWATKCRESKWDVALEVERIALPAFHRHVVQIETPSEKGAVFRFAKTEYSDVACTRALYTERAVGLVSLKGSTPTKADWDTDRGAFYDFKEMSLSVTLHQQALVDQKNLDRRPTDPQWAIDLPRMIPSWEWQRGGRLVPMESGFKITPQIDKPRGCCPLEEMIHFERP